jgi:uncharacterized delta-60 repeat protein
MLQNKHQNTTKLSQLKHLLKYIVGILFILSYSTLFAIDTLNEWFRVNSNTSKTIDATSLGGLCKIVTAPNLGRDYFIGTKSLVEWESFLTYSPSLSFVLAPCSGCTDSWSFLLGVSEVVTAAWTALAEMPTWDIVSGGNFEWTDSSIYWHAFSSSWGSDIYIAQLTSTGVVKYFPPNPFLLKWGWASADYGQSITTDSSGNILVTGYFAGTNTDLFGQPLSSSGFVDIYLAKLSSTGNLMWVKKWWGATTDTALSTSIDSSWDILVTGYFQGTGTDIFGQTLSSSGNSDLYLAKLSSTGNLMWIKKWWNTLDDYGYSTTTDPSGNVLITGNFQGTGTDIFGQTLSSSGSYDIFLAKLSSTGNLMWIKKWWGTTGDFAHSIATDASGNILVTGYFQGTNTDLFGQNFTSSGIEDIFLAKLSSTGNLMWIRKAWNTVTDIGYSTTTDSTGNILLTGYFQGTGTDIFGQTLSSSGSSDIFLAKLSSTGNLMWIKKWWNTLDDYGISTTTDPSGNILLTGYFQGTGTDIFGQTLSSSGSADTYIAKLSSTGNLMWVKKWWNTWVDRTYSISTDSSWSIFVTWQFQGLNTDLFGQNLTSSWTFDILLAKLDADGNLLSLPPEPMIENAWGTGEDTLSDLDTNASWNILVSGWFEGISTEFFGQFLTSSWIKDGYIAYLDSSGTHISPPYTSKKAWGTSTDIAYYTSTDSSGNILITGYFLWANTDIFWTALTSSGIDDIFLAKLSSTGNLMWAKKAWNTGTDWGYSTATDSSGNIFVTGYFSGTGTDLFGQSLTSSWSYDIFLAKLSSTGNLMWAKKAWNTGTDWGYSTATDSSGNIFVTGYFSGASTDLFGQSLTSRWFQDIFLAKLSSTGNLMWAKKAWNTISDYGYSVSIDPSNNILITGHFQGTNTDLFGQTFSSSGLDDIFLAKLSSTGNLMWAKKAWNIAADWGYSTSTDSSWNILVTGYFQWTNTDIFWTLLTTSWSYDIFLAKLSSTGNLMWAKRAWNTWLDWGYSTSTDSSWNILVTGYFQWTNTNIFGQSLTSSWSNDVFLAKLSSTGNLMWAKKAWGTLSDIGRSIAIDPSDNIITTWTFFGEGIDIFGQLLTTSWSEDIYLAKLDPDGNPDPYFTTPSPMVYKMGGAGTDSVDEVEIDNDGNFIIGGYFEGTNTDIFGYPFTSSGWKDIFLTKLSSTWSLTYNPSLAAFAGGWLNSDSSYSTVSDGSGNVFMVGSYSAENTDFFGQLLASSGMSDIFVAKFSATGSLVWVKNTGWTWSDEWKTIALDASGNIFVAGYFEGTNTNIFGQSFTSSGSSDIFLAKLTSTGWNIWVKKWWWLNVDDANALSTNASWSVFVAGSFNGATVDLFGQNVVWSASSDAYLAKLSSTGGVEWIRKTAWAGADQSYWLVSDTWWNILITWYFNNSITNVFGQNFSNSWGADIYAVKLSSTGNLMWAKKAGWSWADVGKAITIDGSGNIYVTWVFEGTNVDIFGQLLSSSGLTDVFLAKLSSTGGLIWAKKWWSTSNEFAYIVTTDTTWNVLVWWSYSAVTNDFFGQSLWYSWWHDWFLSKLSSSGVLLWNKKMGWVDNDFVFSVAQNQSNWFIISGTFRNENTDIFGENLSSIWSSDIFLASINENGIINSLDPEIIAYKAWWTGTDALTDMDTNNSGDILISGYFEGTSTDIFWSIYTSSWWKDGFFTYLENTGANIVPTYLLRKGWWIWSDMGRSVHSDSADDIIVTASFNGSYPINFFGSTFTWVSSDTVIAKFSSTGALKWVLNSDSYSTNFWFSTTIDNSDNIIVAWSYDSAGYVDLFGETLYSMWLYDIFVAKLSSTWVVAWVKSAWDAGYDNASSATTDNSGNVLVTGYFEWYGVNIFWQTLSASWFVDMFVAKLSSTGNLMWAKDAGWFGTAEGKSIATDWSWSIYVAGNFQSTMDFMGQTFTSSWGRDAFILKLSSTWWLIWAKKSWGSSDDRATTISLDNSGNVLVAGFFTGTGVDIFGQTMSSTWSEDLFLAKISSTWSLIWAKKWGWTSGDYIESLNIDQSDNILLSGYFNSPSIDLFWQSLSNSWYSDIYLAKLTSTGGIIWAKKGWWLYSDYASAVGTDSLGNVLVTGWFYGSNTDVFWGKLSSDGYDDIFLIKLDPSGNINPYFQTPATMTYKIGGVGNDSITATKILSDGSIVAGWDFEGTNTQLFLNTYSSSGSTDIFLSRISDSWNPLWTLKWGGTGDDYLTDIEQDQNGYILVSGEFSGTNTNIFGTLLTSSWYTDAFIAKIDTNGNPLWVKRGWGSWSELVHDILPWSWSIFVTGMLTEYWFLFDQPFVTTWFGDGFLMRLDNEWLYCGEMWSIGCNLNSGPIIWFYACTIDCFSILPACITFDNECELITSWATVSNWLWDCEGWEF